MCLESIRLRERSQVPKGTECVSPFPGNVQTGKSAQRVGLWLPEAEGGGWGMAA